ncbi:MAG: glucosaminidase domain-containing protein [Pseudomonadales bacterium]|jgi:Bax protein|nr:glucosaminidase domain-containing protein [Pseudomonadales bacterium]
MMWAKRHRYLGRLLHGLALSVMLLGAARLNLRPQTWAPQVSSDAVALAPEEASAQALPDFGAILDIETKKRTFFEFLQPIVDAQNLRVSRQRIKLLKISAKVDEHTPLSPQDQIFLRALLRTYEVNTEHFDSPEALKLLLLRVDVLPPSLVLAQAANESAWGTSRFAREGYSFFGQWCYREGCGLVPEQRNASAYYEVQSFSSIEASVDAYFLNLNTFDRYNELRQIRQGLRDHRAPIDGLSLAEGLSDYSGRGQAYIRELRQMIRDNNLLRHDYAEAEAATVATTGVY